MIDPIYKTFTGTHIDLSKILSISKPYEENGYYYTNIVFQLFDKPVCIYVDKYNDIEIKSLEDFEKEIEKLISVWRTWRVNNLNDRN